MLNKIFSHVSLESKSFVKLSRFIEENLGIKMPEGKKVMLESRLQKRLKILEYSSFEEYLNFLFSDEGMRNEYPRLIDAVTTNKTDFFREPNHFELLTNQILTKSPFLNKKIIRLWSAASSTGEEPYTLAIVMEEFRKLHNDMDYRILASDISQEVLDIGIKAIYNNEKIAPVPINLQKKYFLKSKDPKLQQFRVKPELRNKISFNQINLMEPYSLAEKIDIVFCRNILIYFDRTRQEKVLRRIICQMNPGGVLILGHSETITGMDLNLTNIAATVYRANGTV